MSKASEKLLVRNVLLHPWNNLNHVSLTGVALTDARWRIPFRGKLEAVEVCVSSSPVNIEIQIWEISNLAVGELIMLDYYVFQGQCEAVIITVTNLLCKESCFIDWKRCDVTQFGHCLTIDPFIPSVCLSVRQLVGHSTRLNTRTYHIHTCPTNQPILLFSINFYYIYSY